MGLLYNDASNEYSEVDAASVTAAPLSMSAWVKPDAAVDANVVGLFNSGTEVDWFRLVLEVTGNTLKYRVRDSGTNLTIETSDTWTQDAWNLVGAVTAAVNDHRVFVNGGGKTTSATSVTPSGINRTTIGRSGDSSPEEYLSGIAAWIAIWNVALSDDEMAALFYYHPLLVRRHGLVNLYEHRGNGGLIEIDLISRNDLTLSSTGITKAESPPIIMPRAPYQISVPSGAAPATFIPRLAVI